MSRGAAENSRKRIILSSEISPGRVVSVLALGALLFSHLLGLAPLAVFILAIAAIVPLAGEMGHATEALSHRAGPTLGGLLNATCGNAAELIIALAALREGAHMVPMVEASITGSILGNILLVLGLAIVVGGWKREKLTFNKTAASAGGMQLSLGAAGLVVPAVFAYSSPGAHDHLVELSLGVAGILLVTYALGLHFSLRTHPIAHAEEKSEEPLISVHRAGILLMLAAAGVGYASEHLVHAVEAVSIQLGLSQVFVGVIVVAIVGNAAEHSTAVWMASKDRMDVAVEIAVGSSVQIALFVAPLLVFVAYFRGVPMSLVFTRFEVVSVTLAVALTAMMTHDGVTNWLEGAQLLSLYAILGVAFYWV